MSSGDRPQRLMRFRARSTNSNRCAHVQDEDFSTSAHGGCLQHKLAGFRDGHKVAFHVGMGHGDRPTAIDLFLESGDHAASRTQDITETNRDEAGLAALRKGLNINLCHSLGRSHDRGR